ncbi:SRPBCC domain-containing protein [Streptomonospora sp. S1-112]|uniref:SRPBCC domain-containing protein n=1 Tax=Streptomonospora mangrovi TaxID=2883123 RepID=A0A9X3NHH1_9ACTN|nr:SRPBCC domain-containing protein [Streptomonospora mangrovi]MDA0563258.1 SRPBCC domain-containing protein [Streptomonospora mangrovi]
MAPVGKTRDAGYQIGVSTTLDVPAEAVLRVLAGARGQECWLGAGARLELEVGAAFRAADGSTGEVRGLGRGERIRVRRHWPDGRWTTQQVAVGRRGARTVMVLHEEGLASGEERELRRDHWRAVARELVRLAEKEAARGAGTEECGPVRRSPHGAGHNAAPWSAREAG